MVNNLNYFSIYTLGCKVNIYESNSIRNQLLLNGLIEKPFNTFCDIYIINTCSVTSKADSKSINIIRRARKNNPNAIVVAMGCFTQMNPDIGDKIKIDILIGNKYKNNIYDLIKEFIENKLKIKKIENLLSKTDFEKNEEINFSNQTRAFIKIQDGCNFMCSYCIIPFSRGRQRSKKLLDVIEEIKNLSKKFNEIVITGVNIAGYDDGENNFTNLIKEVLKIKGNFRIRISSIEPFQINDELIKIVTSNKERFCQHWHICLQSASNNVLKAMNRKYKIEDFYNIIKKIKKLSPLTTFTTDYIVGFPTETANDHELSIYWLKKIKFLDIHIFKYSKRLNTSASYLNDLDSETKKIRYNDILNLNKKIRKSVIQKFIGKELKVIFEKSNSNIYQYGFSSEYIKIFIKTDENLENQFRKVIIEKFIIDGAIGKLL